MARADITFRSYWETRASQRGVKIDFEGQPIFDRKHFHMDRPWHVAVHVGDHFLPRNYHIEAMASVVKSCQLYRGRHVDVVFVGMLIPYAKQVFELAYNDSYWKQAIIIFLSAQTPP